MRAFPLAALTSLAPAALAEEPGQRFRLGLATGQNPQARDEIEPYRRWLEGAIDRPVDLFLFPDLARTAEALRRGRIDQARLSVAAHAALQAACDCVVPLVLARPGDGTIGIQSVLLVRPEQVDAGLEGLAGARVGVGPPGALATRAVPLRLLRVAGRTMEEHFAEIVTVSSLSTGEEDVLSGRLDAVTAWRAVAQGGAAVEDPARFAGLAVIWASPTLPVVSHVVRADLAPELRQRLAAALIDLPERDPEAARALEPDFTGGFAPAVPNDFQPLVEMAGQP